jgi:4-diphosphocytidyl-2-C-methyl-D-erythritol kinase
VEIQAPAKINLYLDVTGKRADGYHELISLMCPIRVHDTVRLSFGSVKAAGTDINISCSHPDVPSGPANIAHKAAKAFFAQTGLSAPLAIEINKQIPVGAGLGGGSSNAAAVLTGLNTFFNKPLSRQNLLDVALGIGADVPFFLFGKPAIARGIGEKLTFFAGLPRLAIILIYPGIPVSTAEIYKKLNLALTKTKKIHTKFIFKSGWDADLPKRLYNALEPVAMQLCPEIKTARQALINCGAAGALMSGSGSSVFGIFTDAGQAGQAFNQLSVHSGHWQVFNTSLMIP